MRRCSNEMIVEKPIGAIDHDPWKLRNTIKSYFCVTRAVSEAKYDGIGPLNEVGDWLSTLRTMLFAGVEEACGR
jgi:hypothetical protein